MKRGFTLAEVLITLGIIGVVAAVTMPTLIQKQNEKATVTALKKFYSTISQAYLMAKEEYGTPDMWFNGEQGGTVEGADVLSEKFTKYMKVTKNCHGDIGCFPDVVYKGIDGKEINNRNRATETISKMLTAEGWSVYFFSYSGATPLYMGKGVLEKVYGQINVDINGFKNPNVIGKDLFQFYICENGIIPTGSQMQSAYSGSFPASCNTTSCRDGWCFGCASWIIYNGNMDYLHCDDLNWNGKTKCK